MTAAQLAALVLTPDVDLATLGPEVEPLVPRHKLCPVCGVPRVGMPLTCRTPACLRADTAAEKRADRAGAP